jgi:hypothetical protein
MNFLGAGDAEIEGSLLCRGKVEPKWVRNRNEGHPGGAGGSELQELTTSDFRHRIWTVLLREFSVSNHDR